jgi:hypothetical protein
VQVVGGSDPLAPTIPEKIKASNFRERLLFFPEWEGVGTEQQVHKNAGSVSGHAQHGPKGGGQGCPPQILLYKPNEKEVPLVVSYISHAR